MNLKNIIFAGFVLTIFVFLNMDGAKADFFSDCKPCHEKRGQLTDPHTSEDCKSCHNWAQRHVGANMCDKCHLPNIHEIHRNGIRCALCHNPPANWTSSRVKIPYKGSGDEGMLIIPPRKECTYCHNINTDGGSLHEIHRSNLSNICSKCHVTEMSKESVTTILKRTGNAKQGPSASFSPLQELLRLFDEIAGLIASGFGV